MSESGQLSQRLTSSHLIQSNRNISRSETVCSKDRGAKKIVVGATHGVFSGPAIQRLTDAPIDEVFVTDTLPVSDEVASMKNLKILSVAPLIGEAMRRIHSNESISTMFRKFGQL